MQQEENIEHKLQQLSAARISCQKDLVSCIIVGTYSCAKVRNYLSVRHLGEVSRGELCRAVGASGIMQECSSRTKSQKIPIPYILLSLSCAYISFHTILSLPAIFMQKDRDYEARFFSGKSSQSTTFVQTSKNERIKGSFIFGWARLSGLNGHKV